MKTHNYQKGCQGEDLAIQFLIEANYEILQRNYKRPSGEIDIISKKEETIVLLKLSIEKI